MLQQRDIGVVAGLARAGDGHDAGLGGRGPGCGMECARHLDDGSVGSGRLVGPLDCASGLAEVGASAPRLSFRGDPRPEHDQMDPARPAGAARNRNPAPARPDAYRAGNGRFSAAFQDRGRQRPRVPPGDGHHRPDPTGFRRTMDEPLRYSRQRRHRALPAADGSGAPRFGRDGLPGVLPDRGDGGRPQRRPRRRGHGERQLGE